VRLAAKYATEILQQKQKIAADLLFGCRQAESRAIQPDV
jgi:hypothetical protein